MGALHFITATLTQPEESAGILRWVQRLRERESLARGHMAVSFEPAHAQSPNSSTPPPHANRGLSSTSVSWAWALRWQRPGGIGHSETGEVTLKAPRYLNYPAKVRLALLDVSCEHRHFSIWELSPSRKMAGLTAPGPGLCNSASSTSGRGDHGPPTWAPHSEPGGEIAAGILLQDLPSSHLQLGSQKQPASENPGVPALFCPGGKQDHLMNREESGEKGHPHTEGKATQETSALVSCLQSVNRLRFEEQFATFLNKRAAPTQVLLHPSACPRSAWHGHELSYLVTCMLASTTSSSTRAPLWCQHQPAPPAWRLLQTSGELVTHCNRGPCWYQTRGSRLLRAVGRR